MTDRSAIRSAQTPVLFSDVASAATGFGSALADSARPLLAEHSSARSFGIALSLDKTLAWQCHTMATASGPAAILAALPGRAGCDKIVAALRARGMPVSSVEETRAALESALKRRSITRGQLKAMALGGSDSRAGSRTVNQLHRQAFQSQSAIRGISMGGAVNATMVVPGSTSDRVTLVLLSLVHDLVRSMSLGPVPVYHRPLALAKEAVASAEPGSGNGHRPTLLTEFCSRGVGPDSISVMQVVDAEVACVSMPPDHADGIDVAFAEVIPASTAAPAVPGSVKFSTMFLALPTETAVCDVFMHKAIGRMSPDVGLYFHPSPARLPVAQPDFLRHPYTPEAAWVTSPRLTGRLSHVNGKYERMLGTGVGLADSQLDDFDCFRVQMEYPPTPTGLLVRWS